MQSDSGLSTGASYADAPVFFVGELTNEWCRGKILHDEPVIDDDWMVDPVYSVLAIGLAGTCLISCGVAYFYPFSSYRINP
ncbi:MAG: hypothetical protein HOH33_03640 [Verrucomicrobia bacterium]|nr:hypothetical protein [Verrucomicrobiota bacterium]